MESLESDSVPGSENSDREDNVDSDDNSESDDNSNQSWTMTRSQSSKQGLKTLDNYRRRTKMGGRTTQHK